jgi:UDP-N-acetylmuramoyl-L-alanyl-D-glutamate--2,6-diaminopimelate ligase
MITLSQLPRLLGCKAVSAPDATVLSVTEDSRRVSRGAVFVAAPGVRSDGHAYVQQAVEAGAIAIIGARSDVSEIGGVPYVGVDRPRRALGILAHALEGDPSRAMTVLGVTGTNGKTSSVLMTQKVLTTCGYAASAFGTLGYDIAGQTFPAYHTTPFGEELSAMFGLARDAHVTHVVMEVSSHALDQDRVAGIEFTAAAFTNLTQDHLDYHPDMESYRRAKLKLFESIEGPGRFTVVNQDDPSASAFAHASRVPCYTYGAEGDCRAGDIRVEINRTRFTASTPWGFCPIDMALPGRHNVSNALCVIALCGGLGLAVERVAEGIASLSRVPGRFEHVDAGQDFQVIVDYAHTEDGLLNVLQAAREMCARRVICLFGCGGDRDKTKRPRMARVVAQLADYAVITSDNPRTEDPDCIIADIEAGMVDSGKRRGDHYLVISDRAHAIRQAIQMAKPGDLVLLAGKGHEDYQIIGAKRIHFDDREAARAILEER